MAGSAVAALSPHGRSTLPAHSSSLLGARSGPFRPCRTGAYGSGHGCHARKNRLLNGSMAYVRSSSAADLLHRGSRHAPG
ncbi:hypothetical protein D3C77_651380 [compost metagenome]